MRQASLADLTEKAWDAQLFNSKDGLARSTGWRLAYHTLRSKGSQSGFPDRVLVRDRIVFVELKREKTKPTDSQVSWLDGLARAGGEVYLWRPSDLEEVGLVLSGRWGFWAASDNSPPYLTRPLQDPWVPRSIWVPGKGRADEAGVS